MIEKEILLNDQGLKITCIIDKDNVSFDMDEDISFLNELIHVHQIQDYKLAYIGIKKFLKIKNNNIEKLYNITNTEIKLLKSIYNNMVIVGKKPEIVEGFYNIKEKINNVDYSNLKNNNNEVHTHLMDIPNTIELMNFYKAFEIKFPIDDKGNIDINSKNELTYLELKEKGLLQNVLNSLRLDLNKKTSIDDLNNINSNRRELLKKCAKVYEKVMTNDDDWINIELEIKRNEKELKDELESIKSLPKSKDKSKRINDINKKLTEFKHIKSNKALTEVYSLFLEMCLKKLNVFSEISFSNTRILEDFSKKYKDNDNFKLLLSIDKNKSIKEYSKVSSKLESLLRSDKVIGIELTGNNDDISNFKDKIEWILPVLSIHEKSILKLDNSLNKDPIYDIFEVLSTIKEVNNSINEKSKELFGDSLGVLPPPRIRITHVKGIEKNNELIKIIKEMNSIVEFNENIEQDLIDFYNKNNIKYIICNDGNGVYLKPKVEEETIEEKKIEKEVEEKIEEKTSNDTLYDKYMNDTVVNRLFNSYMEAADTENNLFGNLNDEMKIKIELDRIKNYINDKDEIDINYIDNRINEIESYLLNKDIIRSKIYLYLLEKECFRDLDISFTTIDYLNLGVDNNNKFEVSLKKLYNLIENEYKYYDISHIGGKRR